VLHILHSFLSQSELSNFFVYINYCITESEVITEKSRTEALSYWPSD